MWTDWKGGSVSESAQAIFILYSLRKQKPKPKQAHTNLNIVYNTPHIAVESHEKKSNFDNY